MDYCKIGTYASNKPTPTYASQRLKQEQLHHGKRRRGTIRQLERAREEWRAYLGTLGPGHQSLADVPHAEHRRGLDVIPVLLGEGVDAARQDMQAP